MASEGASPNGSQYYGELFPPLSSSSQFPTSRQSMRTNSIPAGSKLKSKNITQSLTIPIQKCTFNYFGTRDQTMSDACKLVRTETNCQLEVNSDRDEICIMITGLAENVKLAKQRLTYELETKETIQMLVPKDLHKHILGKKGQKLLDIQKETGTKITVPRADTDSEIINISGPKEYLARAQQRLNEIIKDRATKNAVSVPFPKEYIPFLQTKESEIKNKFNVTISIQKFSEVRLMGEISQLDSAKEYIHRYERELNSKIRTVKAHIPKSKYKYIIGKDGKNLREIMNKFEVSVEIPAKDDGDDQVVLRGTQEKNINEALNDIEKKMNSFLETVLKAPPWSHRYLIGYRKDLEELNLGYSKVNFEFPRLKTELGMNEGDSVREDEFKIRGPPEEVLLVKEHLEQLLKDILLTLTHEVIKLNNKCIITGFNNKPTLAFLLRSAVSKARVNGISVRFWPEKKQLTLDGDIDRVSQTKEDLLSKISIIGNSKVRDLVVEHFLHPLVRGEPQSADSTRFLENKHNVRIKFFGIEDDPSEVIRISGEISHVDVAYEELKRKVKRLQEDTVSANVKLYKEFFEHLETRPGRRVRERIEVETHSRIVLFGENCVANLVGTERDIIKAEALVIEAQDKFLDTTTETILIPSQLHRIIIGQKGKQVQALEAECGGVKIHLPSQDQRQSADENFNPDTVTVTGPSKSVHKAVAKIREISSSPENCFEGVKISPQYMSYLRRYRRAGGMLDDLREKFNVRIYLPARYDKSLSEDEKKIITLIGKEKNVNEAKKVLKQIISGLEEEIKTPLDIPMVYRRNFFKRQAQLLIDLEEDYDISISLSKGSEELCEVTLEGPKIFVDSCYQEIKDLVQAWDDEVTREETVDPMHISRVRGPKNQNLMNLEDEYNVQIKVINLSNQNPVLSVTGAQTQVDNAMDRLLSAIPIEREIDIPPRYIPSLIKSGEANTIEQKHGIKINFPRRGSAGMTILSGGAEGVEQASGELTDRIEGLIQEEDFEASKRYSLCMNIEREYHGRINGRGSMFRKQIETDFGVIIKFPSQGSDDTNVHIVGIKENAEKAEEYILKQVENWESQVSVSFDVPHKYHGRIIGAKGRAINKLKEDFGILSIDFPKNPSLPNQNTIRVTGSEGNVNSCKDYLLEQVIEWDENNPVEIQHEYRRAPSNLPASSHHSTGFSLLDAPWKDPSQPAFSQDEFPSLQSAHSQPSQSDNWAAKVKH
ncbi:Vigilin [Oopsacas minuta]|uniref:Vigilin n=1 Tax=Oopsacas minuta TaxID=111878 RepID=A0AAV7JU90_9METZ|nr:Vigilin [Oopsacas minuta]